MWTPSHLALCAVLLYCFATNKCHAHEIEVECMDSKATTIKEGGIVARCDTKALTRTSTINPWLTSVSSVLQSINASHNHIKHVAVFPQLPRLLSLNLNHNSIRKFESHPFAGLDNLQTLDMSSNMITGESLTKVLVGNQSEDGYKPLPIITLNLGENRITSLHPTLFKHMEVLRELHLDNNPLIVDDKFSLALQELRELKTLNLGSANLKYLPKDVFSGMNLHTLLLTGNEFTQVPDLAVLGHSLKVLNINQNPVQELNSTSFYGLNTLNEIMVSGMPELTIIKSGTFSDLRSINKISCFYNPKLAVIEEMAFWDHKVPPPLIELYLNNNNLTSLKQHILPWTKMVKVTLDGNKWECDCQIHWLANYTRNKKTCIDRITELKCWKPVWLNGTQILFWTIDTSSRDENFPCIEEREAEREEIERLRNASAATTKTQLLLTLPPSTSIPPSTSVPSYHDAPSSPVQENFKLYHFIVIASLVILVIIVASLIGFNRYRQYRPIYNVEKMSSPIQTEMKYMKGNEAEKTQLVT